MRRKEWVGTKVEVLVEAKDALTKMYIGRCALQAPDGIDGSVRFQSEQDIPMGTFVDVEITKVAGMHLLGHVVGEN